MAQYIDKSALVAELKKRISNYWSDSENTMGIYPYALEEVIKYVDSLEVKEVNLEKEAELIANGIMIGVQANRYHTVVYNTKRNDFNHSHLMLAARKGIELGLKIHKNEI